MYGDKGKRGNLGKLQSHRGGMWDKGMEKDRDGLSEKVKIVIPYQ